MRELILDGKRGTCRILLGARSKMIQELCKPKNTVVITDKNINRLYKDMFSGYRTIVTNPGEGHKTLETVNNLYKEFLGAGIDRSCNIVGIGGGIVCDITGFAASTFLRGLPFTFVPTTLLAQVDASVGGKNGVNYDGYKNIVGTINQPNAVLCDFTFLKTLPYDELKNGIAETVKSALIADSALFHYLEEYGDEIALHKEEVISRVVGDSLAIKVRIVSHDETEQDERRMLNFGHTIGHAVERTVKIPHGEAVSIGMVTAARLSRLKGLLSREDTRRIEMLLNRFGLPVKHSGGREAIMDAINKDKKRDGGNIHFVLLDGIGCAIVEKISINELKEVLFDLC